jgi:glutamate dehydrogenase (NADP+)
MAASPALFIDGLKRRYPAEPEFHQATTEVFRSIRPFVQKNPQHRKARILERLVEPERAILFRMECRCDEGGGKHQLPSFPQRLSH